jgi:dTDP-4-dehydrorhamnose 3,5-epimerase
MKFTETSLAGAYLIDLEARHDDRGFNARSWCQREFEAHGLIPSVVQANAIFNRCK